MIPPRLHPEEDARLKLLAGFDSLIQQGDVLLDDLTALAATLCGTPISVVSLVDMDRQYFVGRTGLPVHSTPREQAFCGHAILSTEIFEICDASVDPRFADNPLVTGSPNIRHYAGVPIVHANGLPLGTLCVINHQPGQLTDEQRGILTVLGRQAAALLWMKHYLSAEKRRHHRQHIHARILHDLRPPLRSLAHIVQQTDALSDPDTVQTIQQTAEQLALLADQLLQDSTQALPSLIGDPSPVVIRPFLKRLTDEVRGRLQDGVQLQWQVDSAIPKTLLLHKHIIYRILSNLLNNAIRFTHSGKIAVEVTADADALIFAVRDTGVGIPESQQGCVFQPFVHSAAADGGGTGLGLAIVHQLTQQISGQIAVESEEGRGSRFVLRIPHMPPSSTAVPTTGTVLVVEDVAINRLLARRTLEDAGLTVLLAEDGPAALAVLDREGSAVDVVLLDGMLPGLSGPDIARRIRARFQDTLPVVGWSATAEADLLQRFQKAGVHYMLNKPLAEGDIAELLQLLQGASSQLR